MTTSSAKYGTIEVSSETALRRSDGRAYGASRSRHTAGCCGGRSSAASGPGAVSMTVLFTCGAPPVGSRGTDPPGRAEVVHHTAVAGGNRKDPTRLSGKTHTRAGGDVLTRRGPRVPTDRAGAHPPRPSRGGGRARGERCA